MSQSELPMIRSFQQGDEKGIWDILQEGTYSNINATFVIFLKKRFTQITSLSLLFAGYAWGVSPLFLLVYSSICIGFIYFLILLGDLVYLYGSTLSDIKDIQKSYLECPDHHFWIAEYKGQIAGTIAIVKKTSHLIGSPDAQEGKEYIDSKNKVAWLRRMAVGKKFRRIGIAKMLVGESILFCKSRNYESIFLITTEVHHAARSLYSKIGFKLLGCKPYTYFKGLVTVLTYEYEMIL